MSVDGLTAEEACALDWCLRSQQPGWSADDAAALQAWLDASPLHAVAFLRIEQGWARVEQSLDAVGMQAAQQPARPPQRANIAAPRPAAPRARRRWTRYAWVASLAVLLGGGALITMQQDWEPPGQYTTAVGNHRTVVLADGSRVELNTDTRIRAFFEEGTRQVQLVRGEAYFDVRPDAQRPFIVDVDGQRIVVLGTRFAVRRDPHSMRVVVTHGKVRIDPLSAQTDGKPTPPVIATRGDAVIVAQRSALVTSLPDARLDSELAWRSGFVMFDDVPLSQVAAEFNRYNHRKLVIDDNATAIRISGSFESSNLDAFIRLLQQVHDLKIDENRGAVRVSG